MALTIKTAGALVSPSNPHYEEAQDMMIKNEPKSVTVKVLRGVQVKNLKGELQKLKVGETVELDGRTAQLIIGTKHAEKATAKAGKTVKAEAVEGVKTGAKSKK